MLREKNCGNGDAESTAGLRKTKPRAKVLLAVVLVCIGLAPFTALWVYTDSRNVTPVDLAAPVKAGTIHTGKFTLNYPGRYLIEYRVNPGSHQDSVECMLGISIFNPQPCQNPQPKIATAWVLRSYGHVIAGGASSHWHWEGSAENELDAGIGEFYYASNFDTTFNLDVTLKSDLPMAVALHPRIVVEIHPEFTEIWGLWGMGALAFGAASLLLAFWQISRAFSVMRARQQ